MHGVRLVSTPPAKTSGRASAGRAESRVGKSLKSKRVNVEAASSV
jgi:hypothetical protein